MASMEGLSISRILLHTHHIMDELNYVHTQRANNLD